MEKTTETDSKDRRLKYVEMPGIFYTKANDTRIACRQHLLVCERIGKYLARKVSRDPKSFDQDEYMKDFVIKTAEASERMLKLLEYTHELLQEIANDAKVLCDGAIIRDQLQDQSDTIVLAWQQRDELIKYIYELNRTKGASSESASPRA